MSINFFDVACQEPPQNTILFGIRDDRPDKRAYTDTANQDQWVATVKNDHQKMLVFTSVDKCVIQDHEHPGRGRCDGMLTSPEHLYLIELKEQVPPWQTSAINQLVSTIQFLKANHDISGYRYKKAFACNKKRPHFQELDNEANLRFYREHGFRIDLQAEILVL